MEAELQQIQTLWLKGLLAKLEMKQESLSIFCDSSSALHLGKNLSHLDIKLHFIRNELSKGIIKMVKIHIDENPSDMLTKVVPMVKFKK